MTKKDYIYSEPISQTVEAYFDQKDRMHATREEAIAANIRDDLTIKIRTALVAAIPDDAECRDFATRKILSALEKQPRLLEDFAETC